MSKQKSWQQVMFSGLGLGTGVACVMALVAALNIYAVQAATPESASIAATSADWTVQGSAPLEQFGYVVQNLGDYNGDGYVDVIATAPRYTISPTLAPGAVFIYPGSVDGILPTAVYTLTGVEDNDFFGADVATVRRTVFRSYLKNG